MLRRQPLLRRRIDQVRERSVRCSHHVAAATHVPILRLFRGPVVVSPDCGRDRRRAKHETVILLSAALHRRMGNVFEAIDNLARRRAGERLHVHQPGGIRGGTLDDQPRPGRPREWRDRLPDPVGRHHARGG